MNPDLRALTAMLYTVSLEAESIARRLGPQEHWQYPSAVAVRIYTDDCARDLPKYLRQQTPSELAWRLRYEAALCTGKLAPLRQVLHRAATLANQLEGTSPARWEPRRRPAPDHRVSSRPAWRPYGRSGAELLRTLFGHA
jgi:hypothetical protein